MPSIVEEEFIDPQAKANMLFAVPKKGRLHERILKLLEGAGLDYNRPPRLDIAHCGALPVSIVFLPAADIAKYVAQGDVDMGITGEDIIAETRAETGCEAVVLQKLGFGKCTLALQAPVVKQYADAEALVGKRIVTSFPHLAKEYFRKMEKPGDKHTSIEYVSGSVEVACKLGLADGVVDLVETGITMRAAGLDIVAEVMATQAVLISNPQTQHRDLVQKVSKRIAGYLVATRFRMVQYNISRELLHLAVQITPGKKSPTINPLDDGKYVAVSALVKKTEIPEIMDRLEDLGATDILVLAMENCRM